MMHQDTIDSLYIAIHAEVVNDPAGRGYAGKTPAEIVDLMNAPMVVQPDTVPCDVLVSDVRGYLEARLVLVRLEDWVSNPATPAGDARDAARTLLRVTGNSGITYFSTGNPVGRANVLGLFALLVAAGAGGLTQAHYDELEAMATRTGPSETHHPRWLTVIEGIPAAPTPPEPVGMTEDGKPIFHPGYAGPPNAATVELVAGALA